MAARSTRRPLFTITSSTSTDPMSGILQRNRHRRSRRSLKIQIPPLARLTRAPRYAPLRQALDDNNTNSVPIVLETSPFGISNCVILSGAWITRGRRRAALPLHIEHFHIPAIATMLYITFTAATLPPCPSSLSRITNMCRSFIAVTATMRSFSLVCKRLPPSALFRLLFHRCYKFSDSSSDKPL
ncbi:hypothetical protein KC19_4G221300 [Ceratodon purpureus]|uniref:Uncharacterized protein n=1 Tax=Ceratodon purpureus TaxID=3225 RepID=A0A8T0IEY4_CERPU|nr:hypothetical protein KC19_4G221300 [Ceratodon purpureus]